MKAIILAAVGVLFGTPALAQHGPHGAAPYAGLQDRQIKALSDQQIADLKAGRGMGLALAAELNGYPGPAHVLELADALQLSERQRTETARLFEAMKAEAVPIGERLIADEGALDRLFADKKVTRASLDEALSRIARDQAELRAAHLSYHLAMVELLSPEQTARYAQLRGYAAK
ncbi:MAG: Spy/CpxP family protein refolding chaperone [Reyranella sp.]|jgi:Spy/CpxP family protein refolding chaperone|nr:Spy/CpxP family protein refolding chaperone [Reyranella sp.]MBL6650748.1 Spy/CpxP family protein refolding chaperone [Reyranella sp.]